MSEYDIAIIGGGISGFAAACMLAEERGDGSRIIVIERESQPGYHTTGRSAAMYTEIYGNQTIRSIVRSGRKFLEEPEARYSESSFLSSRGALMVACGSDSGRADQLMAEMNRPDVLERIGVEDCSRSLRRSTLKRSPAVSGNHLRWISMFTRCCRPTSGSIAA